jgi:putative SOS response-associated peptidase YedK
MCGRFALTAKPSEVQDFVGVQELEGFPARYNIAPTQPILAIIEGERGPPGSNLPNRRAMLLRWGLTPAWVKDPRDFPLLINARSETAIGKASFKAAMRHRRILIPASGFYEWYRPPKGSAAPSQAYWVRPKGGGIVAFAGLMETWSSADGSEVDTGAILTAQSNPRFTAIHDRMPVVIAPEDFERWLDCKTQEPREVIDLMKTPEEDLFEAIPVSDLVNKVANLGPEIQERMEKPPVAETSARKKPTEKAADSGQLNLF